VSPKNRIQVELNGGLGNQLFQWASGVNLAIEHQRNLELHTFRLTQRKLGITLEIANRVWPNTSIKDSALNAFTEYPGAKRVHECKVKRKIYKRGYYQEKDFSYNEIPVENKNLYLRGYFQSWKYFEQHIPLMRSTISDFQSENPVYRNLLEQIQSEQWIAIHLRRGDYIHNQEIYATTSKKFYSNAIRNLTASNQNLHSVIFTDSPEYVTELVPSHDLVISIAEDLTPMENLILMSKAQALIGANSTFSWWAGLIMDENKRKIFPSKWFTAEKNVSDLLLPTWEKMEND
jgi:hypothetical protein